MNHTSQSLVMLANQITYEIIIDPVRDAWLTLGLLAAKVAFDDPIWPEPTVAKIAAALMPTQAEANRHIAAAFDPQALPAEPTGEFDDYLDWLDEPSMWDASQREKAIAHLHMMWDQHLLPIWQQRESFMHAAVSRLDQRDWPTSSAADFIRAFTQLELAPHIATQLADVTHINVVLSPFMRLQASKFGEAQTLYLFVAADPKTLPLRTDPIQRSEIQRVADALADDTRLQILELLTFHSELRTQALVNRLSVSQPTVSRHLKQLKNVNLISEHRGSGANKLYRVNQTQLQKFPFLLRRLLSPENAHLILNDARNELPVELRPFLDEQGIVAKWPAKRKGQLVVLDYLHTKFAFKREYSEGEVNDILGQWHTFKDPAYLRRELVEVGLMARVSDGSRYWRQ